VKNIVELAIDAAEAAVVLGARAFCAMASATTSDRQDTNVDKLWDDTKRGVYIENLHTHTESTAEASPEADAGQPLASVVSSLTDDDYESAAFACRRIAEQQIFDSARPFWRGIADRLDFAREVLAIPLGAKK
jgi:hypothetical protein